MRKFLLIFLLPVTYVSSAQNISCDNSNVADAYNLAINTIDINVRRGILAAGSDYGGEWTRDISINSWNGVSLLRPKVAEQSLWSVTINKDTIGHQYWDKIIWVISAFNHYKATGNKEFLEQAYICSANTMKELERKAFDTEYGLFTGPAVLCDGIAGYPEPIYDSLNKSMNVLDHKNSRNIKCLSTNCVYFGAYKSLVEMSCILNLDKKIVKIYQSKSDNLKASILKYLYSDEENKFYYLIDNKGKVDKSQEGIGISFAVIFGLLDTEKACTLTEKASISKYGITCVYPDFHRFSPEKPGRHNNMVWPMVLGFFGQASIQSGNQETFVHEFNSLIHLALDPDKGDYNYREVYNPYTGSPDGGWQVGEHFNSCKFQTWSATAFISMLFYGLAGMHLENESISFSPYLPEDVHYLELKNINYRQADLKIILKGNGKKIKSFMVNGQTQSIYSIDSKLKGENEILIELE